MPGAVTPSPDVAVIGGGIVGCSAAAFLAEAGARVRLFERDAIAAGASGRNSGVVQHPLDEALAGLHSESLRHYAGCGPKLGLDGPPAGLLVVARRPEPLADLARAVAARFPELAPETLAGDALLAAEPALAPGHAALRLDTGRPARPAAATEAFAARARAAGAELAIGRSARLAPGGVEVDGERIGAGAVLVAAGPWTPEVVAPGSGWHPIEPIWGAVAEVRLERPPRHVLEEAGVEEIVTSGSELPTLFSVVTAAGRSTVGSTFQRSQPDAAALAPTLIERGAAFVPALRGARAHSTRACARPQSFDGRPLIGPLPWLAGVYVAAGHGPWGISLGPGSGRLAADVVLGRAEPPAALAAERFPPPPSSRGRARA